MIRRASILLVLLAALISSACGERSEPTGELTQPYPVSVRGAGDRPTVLDKRPERIAVLDAGPAETLIALGAGSRLVAVPAGFDRGAAAKAAVVVRSTGQLNVDQLVASRPDLIVATPAIDELDLARAGREAGAAVYVGPATSIRNVEQATIDLGFLVGAAPAARQIVGRIERKVVEVENRLAGEAPVSVFVDTGFFITVPERSLLGDLVKRARGTSIAGATPGPGPFPLGELVDSNPDVYLATSDSGVTLGQLEGNRRTARLRAVRKHRLKLLPAALVTRAGPRVGEALEAVARALHPHAFR